MSTLAKVVPIPKGDYSSSATYNSLDIVRYSGRAWMCKQDSVTNITPAENDYWMLLVRDGGGGAEYLSELYDVGVTSPSNGQILLYNSSTNKWENSSFTPTAQLNDLTDVTISGQTNGQALLYNSTSGKWENGTVSVSVPIASANTLGGVKVGANLNIASDGTLSATGGGTWNSITGKPFNTVDTNHFTTTNNQLGVHIPEYYVEVNGTDTTQTSANPITLPAGALDKPFTLLLHNTGTGSWTARKYSSLNPDTGFFVTTGNGVVYRFVVASGTLNPFYSGIANSSPCDLGKNLSISLTKRDNTYTGGYIRLNYFPSYTNYESNYFYTVHGRAYNVADFLAVGDFDGGVGTVGSEFTMSTGDSCLLFTYEYNATTSVYRGHHAYYIVCPYVDNPIPKGIAMASASASGVTITYSNVDSTSGKVTIKSSAATFMVDWVQYRLFK